LAICESCVNKLVWFRSIWGRNQ